MTKISVNYDDTDVAKALSKIIKDSNSEEFIKLFTPMICSSSQATDHFFKLLIGNKLWEPIPINTLCRLSITQLSSWNLDKEATRKKYADQDDKIIVTIKDFRGYHDYSAYSVVYNAIGTDGTIKADQTYASHNDLEVIEEF